MLHTLSAFIAYNVPKLALPLARQLNKYRLLLEIPLVLLSKSF
jgi:hypothetical protein